MVEYSHAPVMVDQIMSFLQVREGMIILDATIGLGGHANAFLERLAPTGKIIGIDRDKEALMCAQERLKRYEEQSIFVHDNFSAIDNILASLGIEKIDGALLDLGVSSLQLDNSGRGFSFLKEGPLDMRMDTSYNLSAYDLVNHLGKDELASLLWKFGQERFSRRIAQAIVNQRTKFPFQTTTELASLVVRAFPPARRHGRLHPATRTFQALRIAVNQELESLEVFLKKIPDFLNPGARLCVLSFHSLEDRIVKTDFRANAQKKLYNTLTKKPLVPSLEKMKINPRSRSAKLRVVEKV